MKRPFVLIAICIALLAGIANAEVRSIEGVPFTVDAISETGDGNLKVEIGDSSRLIPENMLDDYILVYYFGRGHSQALDINSIKVFIKNAFKSEHYNKAVLGCKGFFSHPNFEPQDGMNFFKSIPQNKKAAEFYKKLLLSDAQLDKAPLAQAWMIYQVSIFDKRWPKTNVSDQIAKVRRGLRQILDTAYSQAFEEADFDRVKDVTAAEALFFGERDEGYAKRVMINSKIDDALKTLKQGSNTGLISLIQLMRADEELNNLMAPLVIKLIHKFAGTALKGQHYEQALNALTSIDLNWRNDVTNKLLLETLRRIIDTKTVAIGNNDAHSFLAGAIKKDPELERTYTEYLNFLFDTYIERGDFKKTQDVLKYFLAIRPDPNKKNDVLRAKQVSLMLGDSNLKRAIPTKLKEVQTSVPLGYFISFFFSGVYIGLTKLLVIFVFIIAGLYVLYSRHKDKISLFKWMPKLSDEDDAADTQVSNTTMSDRPFFVDNKIAGANLRANPMMQEYCILLDKFKLPRDASVKDVKSAYRTIVKKFHPDLHPNQSEEDKNYFVEMTEAYENVLEIRKKLGLPE